MKFSIITPAYNSEHYIRRTLDSVLSQAGNFEIEYIVVDGRSTDRTADIVREYKQNIESGSFVPACSGINLQFISEKDNGMYDAINKGFAHATGDIFAWINSDDEYLPGALQTMSEVFTKFPDIQWAKGITTIADNQKQPQNGHSYVYNRHWLKAGIYGVFAYFVHQDSVFWRKTLWGQAGPIDTTLKYAGDYELWTKMATFSPLWSVNQPVSVFHKRPGQLSSNMQKYRAEQAHVRSKLPHLTSTFFIKTFFWSKRFIPTQIHSLLYSLLFPFRNRYYIEPTTKGPIIKKTSSYFIS